MTDSIVVVKKNLVVIKQKDSDKSFEFTPGRFMLCMFVTKYRSSSFDCIGEMFELVTFHIPCFSFCSVFVCRVGGRVSALSLIHI